MICVPAGYDSLCGLSFSLSLFSEFLPLPVIRYIQLLPVFDHGAAGDGHAAFFQEAGDLVVAEGFAFVLAVDDLSDLLPDAEGFTFTLSAGNILWGVAIASVIGVLSGILPAWKGASLNPVDAINSK